MNVFFDAGWVAFFSLLCALGGFVLGTLRKCQHSFSWYVQPPACGKEESCE